MTCKLCNRAHILMYLLGEGWRRQQVAQRSSGHRSLRSSCFAASSTGCTGPSLSAVRSCSRASQCQCMCQQALQRNSIVSVFTSGAQLTAEGHSVTKLTACDVQLMHVVRTPRLEKDMHLLAGVQRSMQRSGHRSWRNSHPGPSSPGRTGPTASAVRRSTQASPCPRM
jgi:hypothetical protein